MQEVYVDGTRVPLDPTQVIGKGGEADIYRLDATFALKIFKTPDHPDFAGDPHEQKGAAERIAAHQKKLRAFPTNLPPKVVRPEGLATDRSGAHIAGYKLRFVTPAEVFLKYADRAFRENGGIGHEQALALLSDFHGTLRATHEVGVVLGDLNDLNLLVRAGTEIFVIDADSASFGAFMCRVFTARFVDPQKCDQNATSLQLVRPHTADSDWYAFTVMVLQSLLYVDPFGGVYKPKDPAKRIKHDQRPLRGVTIFDPEVVYPKRAIPFGTLPDTLLHHFHEVFVGGKRGIFPRNLIEGLRWTECPSCQTTHARPVCPTCAFQVPGAVKEKIQVRGTVTATRIFRTDGVVLFSTYQGGALKWLSHHNGEFRREDDTVVVQGQLDREMRYRISGTRTILAKDGRIITCSPPKSPDQLVADSYGRLPMVDANDRARFWLHGGQLHRDGDLGPEYVGDVLQSQTLFWVGEKFGFGFYRAGNLNVAFVFDTARRGINDSVRLPRISGQLIDATCVFTSAKCWFFTSTQQGGKIVNQCSVIRADGTVEASCEADHGGPSWLGTIRGHAAAGNFLLAATDEGVARVEPGQGTLSVTRAFPDTEPFVDTGSSLFAGAQGLYVVGSREIRLLKIS